MKPLLVYINCVGPIDHPEHGKVHQIEMGASFKDSEKPDVVTLAMPAAHTAEALDMAVTQLKSFITKYYPQKKL